jgi:hypothetical protein
LWAVDDAKLVSELLLSGQDNAIEAALRERTTLDFKMHARAACQAYWSEGRFRGDPFLGVDALLLDDRHRR